MNETIGENAKFKIEKKQKSENTLIYLGILTFFLFSPLMVALIML